MSSLTDSMSGLGIDTPTPMPAQTPEQREVEVARAMWDSLAKISDDVHTLSDNKSVERVVGLFVQWAAGVAEMQGIDLAKMLLRAQTPKPARRPRKRPAPPTSPKSESEQSESESGSEYLEDPDELESGDESVVNHGQIDEIEDHPEDKKTPAPPSVSTSHSGDTALVTAYDRNALQNRSHLRAPAYNLTAQTGPAELLQMQQSLFDSLVTLDLQSEKTNSQRTTFRLRPDHILTIVQILFTEIMGPRGIERVRTFVKAYEEQLESGCPSTISAAAEALCRDNRVSPGFQRLYKTFAHVARANRDPAIQEVEKHIQLWKLDQDMEALVESISRGEGEDYDWALRVRKVEGKEAEAVKKIKKSAGNDGRKQGEGIMTLVRSVMRYDLKLEKGSSILNNEINASRRLTVLLREIGPGLLLLLTQRMMTVIRDSGLGQSPNSLPLVAAEIAHLVPELVDYCALLEEYVLRPYLNNKPLLLTNLRFVRNQNLIQNVEAANDAKTNAVTPRRRTTRTRTDEVLGGAD